jgi:hypothetical protein
MDNMSHASRGWTWLMWTAIGGGIATVVAAAW